MPQIENAVVERIDESGSQLSLMRTTLAANRTHLVNFHLASASEGGFAPCLKALAFRGGLHQMQSYIAFWVSQESA